MYASIPEHGDVVPELLFFLLFLFGGLRDLSRFVLFGGRMGLMRAVMHIMTITTL